MKIKKLQLILMFTALFAGTQILAQQKTADVYKTSSTITLDGNSIEWANVTPISIETPFQSETPSLNSATWKAVWNDAGIYVCVEVNDDVWSPSWISGSADWQSDKIELYIDVTTTQQDGGGANAGLGNYQFAPNYPNPDDALSPHNLGEEISGFVPSPEWQAAGLLYASTYDGSGISCMEYFCPWSDLVDENGDVFNPNIRTVLGFDVNVVDNDDIPAIRNRMVWSNLGAINENWINMDDVGLITLVNHEATQIITWANPADITYGTALGTAQLNATANVDGTFVYNPANGTVLNAGANQPLKVTFTPTDPNLGGPVEKTVYINVLKATPVITWANPADIQYGTLLSTTQLNATSDVAGTMVYTPAEGTKLGVGANQPLKVVFTPNDATNYNSAEKTVYINVVKATPEITWANPDDISYGTKLTTAQLNATCALAGKYVYVPDTGTVLNAGQNQPLTLVFIPTEIANYTIGRKTVYINVKKIQPVITWSNPADITWGKALSAEQLNAVCDYPGDLVYTPAAGTILSVGKNQPLKAEYLPVDTTNYYKAEKTVVINVNKVKPVVVWENPADIPYGTLLTSTQLNAVANMSGTYKYNPAAGTKLGTGYGQALKVTFTPVDTAHIELVERTVHINVIKAEVEIIWNNPASIVYGTALSTTQLNATAEIEGTYVYDPLAGTKLNAGYDQSLKVNFTPTDLTNYKATTKEVFIDVLKVTPIITWSKPDPIYYGTLLDETQLNATVNADGTLNYAPEAGTKLEIGEQTLSVFFSPSDEMNYSSAFKSVSMTVLKNTDIQEEALNEVTIYPNPANDLITIQWESNEISASGIDIISMDGSVVYSLNLSALKGKETVDISGFSPGCYFIRVKSDTRNVLRKFIKTAQ